MWIQKKGGMRGRGLDDSELFWECMRYDAVQCNSMRYRDSSAMWLSGITGNKLVQEAFGLKMTAPGFRPSEGWTEVGS